MLTDEQKQLISKNIKNEYRIATWDEKASDIIPFIRSVGYVDATILARFIFKSPNKHDLAFSRMVLNNLFKIGTLAYENGVYCLNNGGSQH